jgi:methanol--5-hydroxybenzimidazolylcobamide Co-methyltransferase
MNLALKEKNGLALKYRNMLIESDANFDPQAYILKPEIVMELSRKIIQKKTPYEMTLTAVKETLELLKTAVDKGDIKLNETETRWLSILCMQLDGIPGDEKTMIEMMMDGVYADKFIPEEYGLK